MKNIQYTQFLLVTILLLCLILSFGFLAPKPSKNKQNNAYDKTETSELNNAFWITYNRELPKEDSLFYLNHQAPIFRKEFKPKHQITKASLFITAAGYYKGTINGENIGKNVLDPAWTDYSKRTYYTSYDITSQIKDGNNCIGVTLGNGFYNPLPLRKWGGRNPRTDLNVGKPTFIAKLVIHYKNGDTESIVTDHSWKYTYGPILKNSVYIGTAYDARKEVNGWQKAGFTDAHWEQAIIDKGPSGDLQKAFFPPVQITKTITPVAITAQEKETYLVDMGVNFTGTYKIKLSGNVGDTVNFRFGERIYDDGTLNPMTAVIGQIKKKGVGGPGAPEIAWQTDSYIIGKDTPSWFEPQFTYHVYRYMEIKGLKKAPKIEDIMGLSIHTNVTGVGNFKSSSKLLNKIDEVAKRTFLSNLVSVQSDCAAREKFGYGGDLNATSESYIMNFDMHDFYRKTIYDWIDAMKDNTFVDTAPYAGIEYCGISWESAYLTTQYYLYLYYNDTDIIKELYTRNKKWMEKVARIHPEGIVKSGLSDHESLEPVPVELTGTSHYLQCAEIMKTFALVMDDKEGALHYDKLSEYLRNRIKTEFWDKQVTTKINRQTLFATLLYHNIVPEKELEAAKDSLQKAIKNGPSGHFNTGIFGTKYVLETASKHISPNTVFDIVNSTEYPGWGFMIANGATTIWETWKESDNIFSNNHPMFGSVSEWFYRWLGGIKPDPNNPGFKKFFLTPATPKGLDYINTKYESPYGMITSNWKRASSGALRYEMTIPKNTTAQVRLAMMSSSKIQVSKNGKALKKTAIKQLETGKFELKEGDYSIIVTPN